MIGYSPFGSPDLPWGRTDLSRVLFFLLLFSALRQSMIIDFYSSYFNSQKDP